MVVDYDDFRLDDRVADQYFHLIGSMAERFGYTVTRETAADPETAFTAKQASRSAS